MTITIAGPGMDVGHCIDVTSRSTTWAKAFSPFLLGPVNVPYGATNEMLDFANVLKEKRNDVSVDSIISELKGNLNCKIFENAWQYSKLYDGHIDINVPNRDWYRWRSKGLSLETANRYPMGKHTKHKAFWWDGKLLSISQARRQVYIPLYSALVRELPEYMRLQALFMNGSISLFDYSGYDHRELGMSFNDVIDNESKSMGHAFVLAMMLEGLI